MFKEIPGYEGIYEISDSGVLRTVEGKQTHSVLRGVRTWKQRELKQKTDRNGYKRLTLYKDKKPKSWLVHRLVAMTYLEQVPGRNIVNHIDGNPANNAVANLEWCDYRHNSNHAFDTGLMTSAIPVVLEDVETGERLRFRSCAKAAEFLGHSQGYFSGLERRGKTYTGKYRVIMCRKAS